MRKGFLSALALLAGDAVLEAQYYPAPQQYPRPVYPQMVPQGPGYYPQRPQAPVYYPMQYAPRPGYYPPQPIPSYNPYAYSQPTPQSAYASPYVQAQPTAQNPVQEIIVQQAPTLPPDPPALSTVIDGEVEAPVLVTAPVASIPLNRPRQEKFWFGADFSLSWLRPSTTAVPLVTTGSINDFNLGQIPGALGSASTRVLFDTSDLANGTFQGYKAEAGYWLDPEHLYSVDVAGFYLMPQSSDFAIQSDGAGNPFIARPVFNVVNNSETVFVDSVPASVDPVAGPIPAFSRGGVNISSNTQMFGGEINGRYHAFSCSNRVHTEFLMGFRSVHLQEDLNIDENSTALINNFLTFQGAALQAGDSIATQDRFETINRFYGFQVGGRVRYEGEWFYCDAFAKGAFGVTDQRVNIEGSSSVNRLAGGSQTVPGGVLAGTTNMGNFQRNRFGIIPEFGFNLGVELTRHIRVKSGYSFMLWNGVVRPGQTIDRNINPNFIPTDPAFGAVTGPARPNFTFNDQLFWVNNFNFGLEYHY